MSFSNSCIYNVPYKKGLFLQESKRVFLSKSGKKLIKGWISNFGFSKDRLIESPNIIWCNLMVGDIIVGPKWNPNILAMSGENASLNRADNSNGSIRRKGKIGLSLIYIKLSFCEPNPVLCVQKKKKIYIFISDLFFT